MYLIAGLGNPTREYEKTRHNVGFSVIDVLADKYNIDVSDRKHKALCGKGVIEGEKVLLLKPQTFMNLSGESIREAVDYYKIDPEGVGAKPPKMDLADYVLSRFGAEEQKVMDEAFGEAAEAAVMMMTTGAERAMNHYNAKKKAE